MRKDGKTPEFDHQASIALFVKTLIRSLDHPEETLAAVFLHDVPEDTDIGHEEIESLFGAQISTAVRFLTKKHRGVSAPAYIYYRDMVKNNIASVVKGADRMHNIQTMQGVFDNSKQNVYIKETEEHVLPMLKECRRKFTTQEPVYENIKGILLTQIELIRAIHKAGTNS
jgi:(p)ppGpp synthase/HD superfamily hydrolase